MMTSGFREKFIGNRAFYRRLMILVAPIIVQQGITSFVNLLDNVMVGGLGTESISAVAIVNQILMVFNLALFGGLSGASIFGAQFFGKGDYEGMKSTFRFRLILGIVLTAAAILVCLSFGEYFISGFLSESSDGGDLVLAMDRARSYMAIMVSGIVPFMLVQCITGMLRESGETFVPMVASISAIFINLVLNYALIFGHFGLPRLEVRGAAIATVTARIAEFLIVSVWAFTHTDRCPFFKGALRSLYVPGKLTKSIIKVGFPLFVNEFLWSLGMTVINQCYSTRGLSSVAAVNITMTISNLFAIVMMSSGSAISIMVGQALGSGDKKAARDLDTKLIFTAFVANTLVAAVLFAFSGAIPKLYNVDDAVRHLASSLLRLEALYFPMGTVINAVYFTIRSGGKTFITFLFDSFYTWVVPVSLAYCLAHFTDLGVFTMFLMVRGIDIIKLVIGLVMLKRDFWLNDMVHDMN